MMSSVPCALKVPVYIDCVMDLSKPVEETYGGCSQNIRRTIRRHLAECRYETVKTRERAIAVSKTMLRPYAENRHGPTAAQMDDETVVALALGRSRGSLKVLVRNGQEVACQLGFANEPFGVKTWEVCRLGYIEPVFSDAVLLDETNTLNSYLAARDAWERGFPQLNFGMTVAKPDGGLLHWKCRRGCVPEPRTVNTWLALSVPPALRSKFFAACPLLFLRQGTLNLAIGWPEGMVAADFRETLRANHVRGIRRVSVYRSVAHRGEDDTACAGWMKGRDPDCHIEYIDSP